MLVVLSPAKKLDETPAPPAVPATDARLLDHAAALLDVVRELKADELKSLMHISDALADLNHGRFRTMSFPFTRDNAKQAVLMFAGDVYVGLNAKTMSAPDHEFAQQHLGILSGLYGLLRPLDLIQPYRLEMGSRLANPRGNNLYKFWGETITDALNEATESHDDQTVVNLASNEYFKSVKPKKLVGGVVTPIFRENKDGKLKTISFVAKRARGAMARWIIDNRVTSSAALLDYAEDDYRYQPELSTPAAPVFARPWRTAASKAAAAKAAAKVAAAS